MNQKPLGEAKMSMVMNMFSLAQERADYWQEFRVSEHRLVLSRYKIETHRKRSRYSLFVFPKGAQQAARC